MCKKFAYFKKMYILLYIGIFGSIEKKKRITHKDYPLTLT